MVVREDTNHGGGPAAGATKGYDRLYAKRYGLRDR